MINSPFFIPAFGALGFVFGIVVWLIMNHFSVDWLKLSRTFRPLLMLKVDISDLNQAVQKNLESQTPMLLNLGCHLQGDYKLKGDPFEIHSRIFLAPKAEYFVEITSLAGKQAFELVGYLEDGTVITTGAVAGGEPIKTQDLLDSENYFTDIRNLMDLTTLLQDHDARMQAHSQVAESPIQVIPKSNWIEFFRYQNRRFAQIHFEAGKMDNKPEGVVAFPATCYAPASVSSANEMSTV